MRRSHVNFKERVWTIPSTKTDTEHRVPLSSAAMSVLAQMGDGDKNGLMFPGATGDALSNMAMASVIVRMNEDRTAHALGRYVDPKQGNRDATVHGFRSTFRDWTGDRTNVPNHVAEMALGHAVSNNVEAAYRRSELFDKRRRLMEAWASYCSKPESRGAEVIPMRA
jgi:integrase